MRVADGAGCPVLSVESVAGRPVTAAQPGGPAANIFRVQWHQLPDLVPAAGGQPLITAWEDLIPGGTPPGPVLLRCPVPAAGDDIPAAVRAATAGVLAAVQHFLATPALAATQLIVTTRDAQPVTPGDDLNLAHAPVWGLVRAAQAENPDRITILDTDTDTGTDAGAVPALGHLARLLAAGEPEAALRGGHLYVPRLARYSPAADIPGPGRLAPAAPDPGGTILITGGTGGLGALIARHLITRHHATRLHLISRRGPDAPGAGQLRADLAALGADITITACDASQAGDLARVLAAIPPGHPLTAVIHTAGTMDNGLVTALTPASLGITLAPKADAAWHLHELTRHHDLSAFVMLSSAAGLVMPAGLANYAAANTFLDALAHHRHARGLPATALSYGLIDTATGLNQATGDSSQRMTHQGLPPLTTDQALTAIDTALTTTHPHLVPLNIHTPTLRAQPHNTLPPLLRTLIPNYRRAVDDSAMASRSRLRRLAGLSPAEQDSLLEDLVRQLSAPLLGHSSPSAVDPERDFLESGFDSLTAMELRNQLNNATGLRLPPMAVFDNKSPAALARFVRAELTARLNAEADQSAGSDEAMEPAREPQTLSALFREAVNSGTIKKSFAMLSAVADVRPNFTSLADLDQVPVPVKLADGPNPPRLICIGSPMATGSPYQLARMASYFRGVRQVLALPLPGFAAGEMLPATMEATIDALTASTLQAADGEPFVMLGYSAGGIFARVITRQLQQEHGVSPDGLVMLDSYRAETDGDEGETNRGLVMAMLEHESAAGGFDVARLSAMGRYVNIVPKLVPGTVDTRVLFIQCTAPFGSDGGQADEVGTDWRAQPWDADAMVTTVAGNHFSILNTDAALPAQAIAEWIESWA